MDSGGTGAAERVTSRGRGGRPGAIRTAALDTTAALTGVRAVGGDADTARALGADSGPGADSGADAGAGEASTERSPRVATKTPTATRAIPPSAAK